MTTQNLLEAAKSTQDFVKYLIVLGVGALGFSLTSLSSTDKTFHVVRMLIMVASGSLALSIFFGILAYGSIVSQIFNDKIDIEASPMKWQSIAQWISFFAGIVILGFAILFRETFSAAKISGLQL
jgi:hypothetical protein